MMLRRSANGTGCVGTRASTAIPVADPQPEVGNKPARNRHVRSQALDLLRCQRAVGQEWGKVSLRLR